ncbi:MAG TPA: FG-GAP-like repeat-containing protein [Bryobacteraceae bacterium]
MRSLFIAGCGAIVCALLIATGIPPKENLLWQYRNLGKAFYENPDTHLQAVQELKKALDLNPHSAGERINYGLALLRVGKTDAGIAQLLQAQKQDPSIPHTWFNLGIAYKNRGEFTKAAAELRQMIRLVPNEPKSHYNLGAVLRDQGHTQEALKQFQIAEKLDSNLAGPHFQLFTLYSRAGDKANAAREKKLFLEAKKRQAGAAVPENMEWSFYSELYAPPVPRPSAANEPTHYRDRLVSRDWTPVSQTGMLTIDSTGTGHADLLVWSPNRIALYRNGIGEVKNSGLEGLHNIRAVAAGDYDNDGLTDLCVLTNSGAVLFHNNHGTFTKYLSLPHTAGATRALWLDYDHDNDLDLLLFGPKSALLRNDGNGKFEDRTASFPFVNGKALSVVAYAVAGDTAARDVVVSYAHRPGVLYRDKLNEVFKAETVPLLPAGARALSVQDFNHDGFLDLVSYAPKKLLLQNTSGKLAKVSAGHAAPSRLLADFNGDQRVDYARILPDGSLHVYFNASPRQHWMTVRIEGIKNLKTAQGATIEMKSGAYYGKAVYHGVPLPFATDAHADADTIRITWPNGLIQNEAQKKTGQALTIKEAQRLSGSCPMIFVWNGKEYQFVTDVLGVAPLGASSGDGKYFPVQHREHIRIPGSLLRPENGEYHVHIAEELHEVSYLDQVQLIAVDHPANTDIYVSDKFKSPPYPKFHLYGAREKIHPIRAIDSHDRDVTSLVAKQDHRYPHDFSHNESGIAQMHSLVLDFGNAAPDNRAVLVLNGWVEWADGSTFLGASQSGHGLVFPYLQVKDSAGKWRTVVKDMGIPSGKPKSIVVNLTGKFLSQSRQVRIVTNLCVYWDEIFLADDAQRPRVRLTPINANAANLHFRGFSRVVVDPHQQQPERFLYNQVSPVSNWNQTPGLYTRYGKVRKLVNATDDRFVIMGSGDELRLSYPAANLPKLPAGWSRDFMLLVDGWAKDADPNTAFSQSVMPLPFHAMSSYPYPKGEHYPNDPEHEKYVGDYLTRPALRLIQPLAP